MKCISIVPELGLGSGQTCDEKLLQIMPAVGVEAVSS
jgi:hypothetical protein